MTSVSRLNKGLQDGWGLPCVLGIKVKSSRMTAVMERCQQEVEKADSKVAVCCLLGVFSDNLEAELRTS